MKARYFWGSLYLAFVGTIYPSHEILYTALWLGFCFGVYDLYQERRTK